MSDIPVAGARRLCGQAIRRRSLAGIAALGILLTACGDNAGGGAGESSRFNGSSGPALRTPKALLAESLVHYPPEHPADRRPVLLVHGTGSTPEENWGWNYVPVLVAQGVDVYTVALPERALADIQDSAEYVVYAIREIARSTRKRVQIIGHSQGGVVPRWALKYWPDLRNQVDDLITLATPRDGTLAGNAACLGGCGAAVWQVSYRSHFVEALNASDPTPGEVSYSSILTYTDEVAFPGVGLDPAPNVSNVFIQDLCPGRVADHISILTDAAAAAAVFDALEHPGPFDAKRFDPTTCLALTMPGVPPSALVTDAYPAGGRALLAILSAPRLDSEPPTRGYATGYSR